MNELTDIELDCRNYGKKKFDIEKVYGWLFVLGVMTLAGLNLYTIYTNYQTIKDLSTQLYDLKNDYNLTVVGTYHRDYFKVYTDIDEREMLVTCVHETGHNIWQQKLSNQQVQDYTKIWNETTSFVTNYARKNAEEDFCDSLAYSIVVRQDSQIVPQDRRKFVQNVFNDYLSGGKNENVPPTSKEKNCYYC